MAGRVIDVRAVVVGVVPVPLDERCQIRDDAAFERDRSANEGRRVPHFRDERLVREPFCFAREQAAQRNMHQSTIHSMQKQDERDMQTAINDIFTSQMNMSFYQNRQTTKKKPRLLHGRKELNSISFHSLFSVSLVENN